MREVELHGIKRISIQGPCYVCGMRGHKMYCCPKPAGAMGESG
ncbi:unnamed protein product, partial [Choristocarpus tenellus]